MLTKNIFAAPTICFAGLLFKHFTNSAVELIGQPKYAPISADFAGTFSIVVQGHIADPLCENAF